MGVESVKKALKVERVNKHKKNRVGHLPTSEQNRKIICWMRSNIGQERVKNWSYEQEKKPLGCVYVPYMKVIPDKFSYVWDFYTGMIFRTNHILRSSPMRIKQQRDLLQTMHFFYSHLL
jgi:hypothetical protein